MLCVPLVPVVNSLRIFLEVFKVRNIIHFECGECKRKNYVSDKNKQTKPDKLKLKKYCRFCRKHTEHKETK